MTMMPAIFVLHCLPLKAVKYMSLYNPARKMHRITEIFKHDNNSTTTSPNTGLAYNGRERKMDFTHGCLREIITNIHG